MFEEVDYLREGDNAERFASLFGILNPTSNPSALAHAIYDVVMSIFFTRMEKHE